MSDNSTGSSSSANSWTLLSTEEAAIDNAEPVDDGTESIDDAPSLPEEVAGSSLKVKPSKTEVPHETVLSEEGHQICQETAPKFFEEGTASGLITAEDDPEICAPVIHDTLTSSPPDNDLLGAVPFSIAAEAAFFFSKEPSSHKEAFTHKPSSLERTTPTSIAEVLTDTEFKTQSSSVAERTNEKNTAKTKPIAEIHFPFEPTDNRRLSPEPTAENCLTTEHKVEINAPPKPLDEVSTAPLTPQSDFIADTSTVSDISLNSVSSMVNIQAEKSCSPESLSPSLSTDIHFRIATVIPYPETTASSVLEESETSTERDESQKPNKRDDMMREAEVSAEHPEACSRLRLRHVQCAEEYQKSSDEEEQEEGDFKLQERKAQNFGFSLNHLIIGSLVLLCLGSLFFSGDYDGLELSDQDFLQKLAQENEQISILEAQIQSQKEELDKALRMAAEKGITEKENARMKEELSALTGLKEELKTLKARVAELTQLPAKKPSETSLNSTPSSHTPNDAQGMAKPERWLNKKEELRRQKTLLEQSRERLEGMKKQGWNKKGLSQSLAEMQQRLSDQLDDLVNRDVWKRKNKDNKGGKMDKNEQDEKWNRNEMEKRNEKKADKGKNNHGKKHKEHFKKYSEEWEHKKNERRLKRERRKQKSSWQMNPVHQHSYESKDFWNHQDKKLRRNQTPSEHCHDVVDCAGAEGLIPVKLPEFQTLLQNYLGKFKELTEENKEALHCLVTQFFRDGIFSHDRMLFSKFAEDVADILEDLADALKEDDMLEQKMEEFEREVLWKFTA